MPTPLSTGLGQFMRQPWFAVNPGVTSAPDNYVTAPNGIDPAPGVTINYDNVNSLINIQIGNYVQSAGQFGSDLLSTYFYLTLGLQNNIVLFLVKQPDNTNPSESIYTVYFNSVSGGIVTLLNPTKLAEMPSVQTSPAPPHTQIPAPCADGTLFLFSYVTSGSTPGSSNISGRLYSSGNSTPIWQIDNQAFSNVSSFVAVVQPTTEISIYQNSADPGNLLETVAVPDILTQDDVYVRDWTDTALSGDPGNEPSTHPVFYTTSDVWNQYDQNPGFNSLNQPIHYEPDYALGNSNYLFTRIWRGASPIFYYDINVYVTFLGANYSVGGPYEILGSQVVNFPASKGTGPVISPGLAWTPPVTNSPHYCLAVEISTSIDWQLTELNGFAPGTGPGQTDSEILDENNKAQRNTQVVNVLPPPPPSAGLSGKRKFPIIRTGIIRNAQTTTRNMELVIDLPENVSKHLENIKFEAIGGKIEIAKKGEKIIFPDMKPGEIRWLIFSFEITNAAIGNNWTVSFTEMIEKKAVNGIAFIIRTSELAEVIKENVNFHLSIENRFDAILSENKGGKNKAVKAKRSGLEIISKSSYIDFLRKDIISIKSIINNLLEQLNMKDHFGLVETYNLLENEIKEAQEYSITTYHSTLLNMIDACMTMIQLSK